jgi:hypothetical protein
VSDILESPPDEVAAGLVAARLATAGELASILCGLPASGLSDVRIDMVPSSIKVAGGGQVSVTGRPLLASGAAAPADRICKGTLSYHTVRSGDSGEWALGDLELWEVATEGVHWTRPSRGRDWD